LPLLFHQSVQQFANHQGAKDGKKCFLGITIYFLGITQNPEIWLKESHLLALFSSTRFFIHSHHGAKCGLSTCCCRKRLPMQCCRHLCHIHNKPYAKCLATTICF
jgi:hypothetical protein